MKVRDFAPVKSIKTKRTGDIQDEKNFFDGEEVKPERLP